MRLILRRRGIRRDDASAGFTLIELLVTVSIMGLISAGLVGVVISYLKTTVDTRSRYTESFSVQLAATYWQRDVASIGVRGYDAQTKSFPLQASVDVTPACALPSGPLFTTVTTLAWSKYASNDSTVVPTRVTVSYVAQRDASTGAFDLLRIRCTGVAQDSRIEVAHALTQAPTRACDVTCSGSGAQVPRRVTLTLSVRDPDGDGSTAFSATLTGERRQS